MKIQKYHFWLAFFFLIFFYTFGMIVWTIKSAVDTPVYEDRSFMEKYQDVDNHYNKMVIETAKFNNRFETKVLINDRTVGMDFSDIQFGQRSLEKHSKNQDMMLLGENSISLTITDKKSNASVEDAKVEFQITRAIEDMYDINLDSFKVEQGIYSTSANIEKAGNWNIIGKITIGKDIGYLYIKTNTQK